jgi:hypothetical protein
MSVGRNSPLKAYYMNRGRLIYIRRNATGLQKLTSLLFFSFLSVPKNSLKYLMSKRMDLLKAFWRGYLWHYTHRRVKRNPRLIINKDGSKSIVDDETQKVISFD